MSRPVTLVAWEDATKKPPDHERWVWSDVGEAAFWAGVWLADDRAQPSVWCDPVPPGPDALTVEDLRVVLGLAECELEDAAPDEIAAEGPAVDRFRAALAALPTPPEGDER